MIFPIRIKPQGQETRLSISDDHLSPEKLTFVPIYGNFKFTIIIKIFDDVDVVI